MYAKIIKEIKSGLTGDSKHDIAYLNNVAEEYRNHELNREIIREIGRMMAYIMTDEDWESFAKAMEKDKKVREELLTQARKNTYRGDLEGAANLYREIIEDIEKTDLYVDDSQSIYREFAEPFEHILFLYFFQPEREVRVPGMELDSIYHEYGSLMMELKQYEEAEGALAKAIKWNPVNSDIRLEYEELFKVVGDMDALLEFAIDTLRVSFCPENIAKALRDIAYSMIEKKEYYDAAVCLTSSLGYDSDSDNAYSEMKYIESVSNVRIEDIDFEDMDMIEEKYGFMPAVNKEILDILYDAGQKAYGDEDYDVAYYFYGIIYNLTEDSDIEEILIGLKAKLS